MGFSTKYNFIISPDRNAWDSGAKKLFIAEPYVFNVLKKNKELKNYADIKVAPHHRDTKDKLKCDHSFVDEKYKKYIPILAKRLNKIHGVSYDDFFWKKCFSLSLIRYITSCYDVFKKCEDFFDPKLHYSNILEEKSYYTPIDFQDHRDFFSSTSFGQEQIFSIYFHLFYPNQLHTFEELFSWPPVPVIKRPTLELIKRKISNITKDGLIERFLPYLNYFYNPTVVITGSFFSARNMNKLIMSGKGRIQRVSITENNNSTRVINNFSRDCLSKFDDNFDNFDKFFFRSVYSSLPLSFVENFKNIYDAYYSQLMHYKNLKYVVNESWIGNHKASIFIAIAQQNNIKHIYNEHNFLQHHFYCNNLKYLFPLVDQFITLGWIKSEISNIYKGSSLYDWTTKRKSKVSGIAFITGSPAVKMPEFSSSYGDFGSYNAMSHLKFCKTFFSKLSVDTLKLIQYRSYPLENFPASYFQYPMVSYDKDNYISEYLKYCVINDTNSMSGKDLMAKSSLVVIDYLSTSYIESIRSNIPTVFLWNKDIYHLEEGSYSSIYDELISVGVCQTSPVEAANFIEKIKHNPEEWWHSKKVQKSIKKFIGYNFGKNDFLIDKILQLNN